MDGAGDFPPLKPTRLIDSWFLERPQPMVLIGLLLIVLAAAAGYFLVVGVASLTDQIDINLPFGTLNLPPLAFLITGMAVISLFWLGWVLLSTGTKRRARLRREAKEAGAKLKAEQAATQKRLQDLSAIRDAQLDQERRLDDQGRA